MLERPYMSFSALELEALFLKTSDNDLLEAFQFELNHRRTKSAKKLLIEVNKKLGVTTEATKDSSKWKYELIHLKKRYDLLRSTFTIEGEILARWGMTSAIPEALEAIVLGAWSKVMTASEDEFGRTIAQLSSDIEKLKVERKGISQKEFTNLNSRESSGE